MTFTGNTFNGTSDADGALLGNQALDATTFVSDGTGHAVYITTPGSYTWTDLTFTGYGADATTDAVIYNNSGGAVTINASSVTGSITFRNGASASTTINNNVSVTFDGMRDNSEVRVYLAGTNTEVDGIEDATAGTADNRSFTWSEAAATSVDYVIHNWSGSTPFYQTIRRDGFSVPAVNTTIDITQQIDRNAE